jgi:cyclophilin family peptidyl-prolyl cis-trans isomerase
MSPLVALDAPLRGWLVLVLLAVSLPVDAVAARAEEKVVFSEAYTIDRKYKSMEGPFSTRNVHLVDSAEPELIWLLGVETVMVGEDGETLTLPEFMCHVNVDIDLALHRRSFGGTKPIGERVVTLSQGQLRSFFPDGFALPLMSNEPLIMTTQVLNHNFAEIDVKVRHRVTFHYVRDCELGLGEEPLPLFNAGIFAMALVEGPVGIAPELLPQSEHGASCLMRPQAPNAMSGSDYRDLAGRRFTGHWVVKPGREENRTMVTSLLRLPFDTTLHHAAVHLHPYAESLELRDATENRTLFTSVVKASETGLGLDDVSSLASPGGIPLYRDHEYELVSVYDNTSGTNQDSMAVMYLGLLDREFEGPHVEEEVVPEEPEPFPEPDEGPRVILETLAGEIELMLYPGVAPATVGQFIALVEAGVYDSLRITRIEPGFVIQTGMAPVHRKEPLSAGQQELIKPLRLEPSPLAHRKGSVSMAHWDDDLDSGETSFSIVLDDAPHLDGRYTIFGRVVTGWDAIETIEGAPRLYDSTEPAVEVLITRARVVRPDSDHAK